MKTENVKTANVACSADANSITVAVYGHEPIILYRHQLDEIVLEKALFHGLKQKLIDAAALPKGSTNEERYEEIARVADNLRAGLWSSVRAAGSGGTLLARALVRMYDGRKTLAEVKAGLEKFDRKQQLALLNSAKVKPFADTIRAEDVEREGATAIGGDELLEQFDQL